MNEREKHSRQYNASDIREYLDGKLSPAEMHALEKAAMDDPFLADAMEGMAANDQGGHTSFETGVDELKKRLLENTKARNKKRAPRLFRWQAAAAVLLLMASGYLSYTLLIRKAETAKAIAQDKTVERILDSAGPTIKPAPVASQSEPVPGTKGRVKDIRPLSVRESLAGKKRTKDSSPEPPAAPHKRATVDAEIAGAKKDVNDNPISAPAPEEKRKAEAEVTTALSGTVPGIALLRKGQNDAPAPNYLQGFVTDSAGNPVSAASVSLKNKKTGVLTDKDGFFKLKTNSADSNQDVVVSSVGYLPATTSVPLSESNSTTIQLQGAGNALNDVVVTAYGIQRPKKTNSRESPPASPAGGWDEFDRYLHRNKKITTADSTLTGRETVSFVVHKNGELSDFKIGQSLSPAHDAELIRLIKQGPAWKLLRGNKQRCTVSLQF